MVGQIYAPNVSVPLQGMAFGAEGETAQSSPSPSVLPRRPCCRGLLSTPTLWRAAPMLLTDL